MSKTNAWLNAARLRTLPLSFSGIIVGAAMGFRESAFEINVFILALLTTLGFQVLSNFANDYGDGVKGTDNENRIGPKRTLQSGLLTRNELKKGILITAFLSLIASIFLVFVAFGKENTGYIVLFFLLGIASIVAAIKYTVGNSAYGYKAMGDLFVFIFFGLLSVMGSYFLFTQSLSFNVLLPAITVGLLSIAVLNLNNMRDLESDLKVGKITIPVLLGEKKSKKYHAFLLLFAYAAAFLYFYFTAQRWWHFIPLMAFLPILKHYAFIINNNNPAALDPELKKVALCTFLFSILFFVVFIF